MTERRQKTNASLYSSYSDVSATIVGYNPIAISYCMYIVLSVAILIKILQTAGNPALKQRALL